MSAGLNYILDGFAASVDHDITLAGITLDSRKVKKDFGFFALNGFREHGLKYAQDAVANGAGAIIYENGAAIEPALGDVAVVGVDNLSARASEIAGRFYDNPSEKFSVVAITGTNGKSSVACGLRDIFSAAGFKAAVIGTLGFGIKNLKNSSLTTPDAINLQKILSDFAREKVDVVTMEASSHGLALNRLAGVRVKTAVFTNLSHDHLDFHRNIDDYAAAKEKLLRMNSVENAVINADDDFGRKFIAKYCKLPRIIEYGMGIRSDVNEYLSADKLQLGGNGLSFELNGTFGSTFIRSSLLGKFNVGNLLAIIGAFLASGGKFAELAELIADIRPPKGRMQFIGGGDKPLVVVDYAHTPDALKNVLQTLKSHTGKARLITVFGCGGERDRAKRPLMGEVASTFSDVVIITDDNPRREDPDEIIRDIMAGVNRKGAAIERNRKQAIYRALNKARPGDIVVIAGKGHESGQIVGDERIAFSDLEIALEYL